MGGFTDIDGTIAFYLRLDSVLKPTDTVLDVGCGRGEYARDPVRTRADLRVLRGRCNHLLGIDPDPAAAENPCLDEFRPMAGQAWPVDDGSINLCLADNVLEHVEDPNRFFAECRRVLRVGGKLLIRTPNALGYATMMSRLIPDSLHPMVLRRVQPGREPRDVFPTFYRCNTPARVRRGLANHDFDGCVYGYGAEPGYLGFSAFAYAAGVAWTKLAPRTLQGTIFAFAQRLR